MEKAKAKIFLHEDPDGSKIHSCFKKKCPKSPTVFFRSVFGTGEELIPVCSKHVAEVAGVVVRALLAKDVDDPNQGTLFGEEGGSK